MRESKLTVRGGKLRALLPQPHARFRHLGLSVSRLLAASLLALFVCRQRTLWSAFNGPVLRARRVRCVAYNNTVCSSMS